MSDLSELFDRDPLLLSEQDLDKIIQRMRENQTQYELGAKPVKKPTPAKEKKLSKTDNLLKDLGF